MITDINLFFTEISKKIMYKEQKEIRFDCFNMAVHLSNQTLLLSVIGISVF